MNKPKIQLSKDQKKAAEGFQDFLQDESIPEMLITGPAGTGKSFLVKYLLELAESQAQVESVVDPEYVKPDIYLTATTHKAANVLANFTYEPTRTIHSLLGLKVQVDKMKGTEKLRPGHDTRVPRKGIVFVDEASMIGRELLSNIRHRQKNSELRFVFIGDVYQLSPVKEPPSAIFSQVKHAFALTKIHRQAQGNPIIMTANDYRQVLDNPEQDWPIIPDTHPEITLYDTSDDFLNVIKQNMSHMVRLPFEAHKILSYTNKTRRMYGNYVRRLNGYRKPFEPGETLVTNKPVFNNNPQPIMPADVHLEVINATPVVSEFNVAGHSLKLKRDHQTIVGFQPDDWNEAKALMRQFAKDKNWHDYFYLKHNWLDCSSGFALTTHKAQGSTYDNVYIDLNDIGSCNQWEDVARLTYVAMSRAKYKLHIFGKLRNRYQNSKVPKLGLEVFNCDFL